MPVRPAYLLSRITPKAGDFSGTVVPSRKAKKQSQRDDKYGVRDLPGNKSTRRTRPEGFIFGVEAVGYATAYLPDGLSDLFYCKYGHGDELQRMKLYRLVGAVILDIAKKEGWNLKKMKPNTMKNVVETAVSEALMSGTCIDCNGTKVKVTKNRISDCVTCDGTGYGRLPLRARAHLCDMHHTAFMRNWLKRYNMILSMLTDWENEAAWLIYDRQIDRKISV